jgi:peptidyl-prolyl cis-trans isomerase SurA
LIKKIITIICLVITSTAISYAANEKLDAVIAVVGDEIIMQSELDAYTNMRLSAMDEKPDLSKVNEYKKEFIKELVDGKILLAHAKDDTTIQISNQEVENAVKNHIANICQQNNIPMDSLESVLMRYQGMTLGRFKTESRRAIKEQMYKQRVQQMLISSIKVSRKDVEDFYVTYKDSLPEAGESVLLSKIAIKIKTSDNARQVAYDKIRSVKEKIDAGEDFTELAKKFSESPEGADGGDLGFISKGSLGEIAFEEKAFSLSTGQTSDIFETRIGFHIIKAIEKKDQKIHIRQIFVKVAPADNQIDIIKAKLDSIRMACKTQEEFVKQVVVLSDDNNTKIKNGSMGWKSVLELPKSIQSEIDTFPAGFITKPINEDKMVAIYRIDNRAKNRKLTIEDDYPALEEKTKDILGQKKLIDMVEKWRNDVYIQVRNFL